MEFSCNDNGKYILIIIVSNSSLNAEFKYEKEREGNNIKSKLKEIFILFNIMFLIISILCPNISNANDDVVAKIWNALKNEGFSDYAVSGVLGNIYQESLEEIQNKERYQKLKKSFQDRKPSEELCKSCTFKEK